MVLSPVFSFDHSAQLPTVVSLGCVGCIPTLPEVAGFIKVFLQHDINGCGVSDNPFSYCCLSNKTSLF